MLHRQIPAAVTLMSTAQKRIDQMGFPALVGPRIDLGWKVTQNINTSPFRLCYSMIVQLCKW